MRIARAALPAAALALAVACSESTAPDRATIVVVNETAEFVEDLFIAPCDDQTWGADHLRADETIDEGDERSFEVDPGCHDLAAALEDASVREQLGAEVEAGEEYVWVLADGGAFIAVDNGTSLAVFFLYLSPCSETTWGPDELGPAETIEPGSEAVFEVWPGCWDLRAEFSDDTFVEDYGVELEDGELFTWELID